MTAMDDGPPTPSTLSWAAARTVDQHQVRPGKSWAPGTCRQCGPDGCGQLSWAEQTLAQLAAARRP